MRAGGCSTAGTRLGNCQRPEPSCFHAGSEHEGEDDPHDAVAPPCSLPRSAAGARPGRRPVGAVPLRAGGRTTAGTRLGNCQRPKPSCFHAGGEHGGEDGPHDAVAPPVSLSPFHRRSVTRTPSGRSRSTAGGELHHRWHSTRKLPEARAETLRAGSEHGGEDDPHDAVAPPRSPLFSPVPPQARDPDAARSELFHCGRGAFPPRALDSDRSP
jgi:hypothetical protein